MGSSDENFGPARFFDERLAQSKGRWERLPRPESREPLSGGGCRHFAVFRQKTRIPDGIGMPERGNSAKYAVLIRKIGLLLNGFAKNRLVFTEKGEGFHEICGSETKNPGYLQLLGRNSVTVLME